MASLYKPLLLVTMLVAASLTAQAQSTASPDAGSAHHMGRMDPAKMQEMMVKHRAELKEKLRLSPAQEHEWTAWVAAMQPPAGMAARLDPEQRKKMHEELQQLSTPERIDRMNAMKAQHDAAATTRGGATKAFYAVLTAEQQKVFDANTMRRGHRNGMEHGKPPGKG